MSQPQYNTQPSNVPQAQPGYGQYYAAPPAGWVAPGTSPVTPPAGTKKKGELSRKIALGGAALMVVGLLAALIGALWPSTWQPTNLESIGQQEKTITVEKGSKRLIYLASEDARKALIYTEGKCLVWKEDGSKVEARQDKILSYDKDGEHYMSVAQISEAGRYQVACPFDGFIGDPINLVARQSLAVGVLLVVLGAVIGGVAFVVSIVRRR